MYVKVYGFRQMAKAIIIIIIILCYITGTYYYDFYLGWVQCVQLYILLLLRINALLLGVMFASLSCMHTHV